ncbi:MAG: hypothetical protein QOJ21_2966 [Solirubrobacteraceae bacterium]|jgi:hypothetical protein|nr:hypothetical protein [Solirubrobacteraceae bacterium]
MRRATASVLLVAAVPVPAAPAALVGGPAALAVASVAGGAFAVRRRRGGPGRRPAIG